METAVQTYVLKVVGSGKRCIRDLALHILYTRAPDAGQLFPGV
jgi:hypothetical protein